MTRWDMFNEIKKLKEKGLKRTQVARALNSDPRTIKKYWDMSPEEFEIARASFKQKIMGTNMSIYRTQILAWLKEHNDISGAQVYDWLKERFSDFSMAERTVREYVGRLRKDERIPKLKFTRDYLAVPESEMGKQAQVDMGQIRLKTSDGKSKKIYVFAMSLSHSRYKFTQWQAFPFTTKDLITMHNLAFKYFDGIPKEVVYDQDRAMFVSENDGDIIMTTEFQKYVGMVGFKVHLCRAYDPESKGKIEAVVKYVKNNFAKNRIFTDIEEFNQLNNEWLNRTGNGKMHSITKKIPAEAFALEKQTLLPIPGFISSYNENPRTIVTYSLTKDNTVMYKANRYQLPKGTYTSKNREVGVEVKGNIIKFFAKEMGNQITTYKIPSGTGILLAHPEFTDYETENHSILKVKSELLNYFADKTTVMNFLEMIQREKPRYLKEQYTKLKKIIELYPLEIVEKVLKDFILKNTTNLSELDEVITGYVQKEKQVLKDESSIPLTNIPEAMKHIKPQIRAASEYHDKLVRNI